MNTPSLQRKFFLLLLVLVTIAFGAILEPFFGAVFWGGILALLFAPVNRWILVRMPRRRNLASLITLTLVLLLVIVPIIFITASLTSEATALYERIRSGELNFSNYVRQIIAALPNFVHQQLERLGLLDLQAIQQRLTESAARLGQLLAPQALNVGQVTLNFLVSFSIMMYLLFFLLRDGSILAARVRDAIPLADSHKRNLLGKFATVVRATVKGNIAVAATQGALGGLIFWILGIQGALLWGVLMAFLSLLPAVGAGLIWGPVALYFLATGHFVKGAVLTAYGVMVIGLVDNILRPQLVGKDTRMPDWVVLISTVGGLALLGLNGFVIGPLVAALFMATWDIFASDKGDDGAPPLLEGDASVGRDGSSGGAVAAKVGDPPAVVVRRSDDATADGPG